MLAELGLGILPGYLMEKIQPTKSGGGLLIQFVVVPTIGYRAVCLTANPDTDDAQFTFFLAGFLGGRVFAWLQNNGGDGDNANGGKKYGGQKTCNF